MRIFVGITDRDWFSFCAAQSQIEEVNLWRVRRGQLPFKALNSSELFLFTLHSADNYIAGGGFFTKFQQLPINLAWEP
jgi:putative restriction endonuclease